jgi:AbrB family looped-hinge helix DNA binding protein
MHAVKLSPDFRIEIPQEVREKLALQPGQEVYLFERDGQIRIARRAIEELRGMCPGMDTEDYRDRNDRF